MKKFVDVPVYANGELKRRTLVFGTRVCGFGGEGETVPLPDRAIVLPGFLDEHIHGAGGADGMDGTPEAFRTIAETLVKEGTTSFVSATMTQRPERISRALRAAAAYRNAPSARGANLLGVHLEGPFLSRKYAGAQPPEYLLPPSVEAFRALEKGAEGIVKIVTLAPEEEGAEELVRYLSSRGIVPSIGHTRATFDDVVRAAAAGAKCVTHTFNAQSPLHHREAGTVGGALLLDELCAELICDKVHVSLPAVRLLAKCKPRGKLILVTDAMRAKGLGDGESELGGQRVIVKDGLARLENGTLAGSLLKMNEAVRNLIEAGVSLPEAVDAATIDPARNLGVDGELGSVEVGKRADFAVVDEKFDVLLTVVGGEIVYRAEGIRI